MTTGDKRRAADILIVDDTPANLQLLAGMLKERGYRARPVPDGKLALAAARREPPDLVLLDINMPDMNGYEVCAELKDDPVLREVPVIFISANVDVFDKVKAFALGGVDYVTKPFHLEEVQARVATHLELRRQQRELEQSYRRLAELERMRDSLVHMLVHDLRSPLASICGLLELVRADTKDLLAAESARDIDDVLAAAKDMIGMVSAILDVSKLESGQLVPVPSDVDLVGLAGAAARQLGSLVGARALTVEHERATVTARVDRELISRVLQNLLANALHFTPGDGRIRVVIEALPEAVRVSVADTGPGIAAEHRERIFEKFAQIDTSGRRRSDYPSTGLGLAFCKLAVEAHGGRIGVDSEVGEGSTFWFELPSGSLREEAPPATATGCGSSTTRTSG